MANSRLKVRIQSSKGDIMTMNLKTCLVTSFTALAALPLLLESGPAYAAATTSAVPAGWTRVPGGAMMRSDCVHEVPSGAKIELTGDVTLAGSLVAHFDPCPESPIYLGAESGQATGSQPGLNNNGVYVAAVQQQATLSSGDNLDFLDGSWTVPPNPEDNGQEYNPPTTIYLWNGLLTSSQFGLMQPVLQWGPACGTNPGGTYTCFGGAYWLIASWLVTLGGAYVTYPTPQGKVNAGDTIYGGVELYNQSGSTLDYDIIAWDTTSNYSTWLAPSVNGQWTWAVALMLEAWNVTYCDEFYSAVGVYVDNLVLDHGYPNYTPYGSRWSGEVYSGYVGPNCQYTASYFLGTGALGLQY
jgi:hypothetical protein